MRILVLNGSPRPHGGTAHMVDAFRRGAENQGHEVEVVRVADLDIHGCRACEYCHTRGQGHCIQKDGMETIYPLLLKADMLVLASPVYYHDFSGQLKCAIDRFYAVGDPGNLPIKRIAMLLCSGAPDVYDATIYSMKRNFCEYLGWQDMGVITAFGNQAFSKEKQEECRALGAGLSG
jgi:multimeric flavodoxin WrbA